MDCIPFIDCATCDEKPTCLILYDLELSAAGMTRSCISCGKPGVDGICMVCVIKHDHPY